MSNEQRKSLKWFVCSVEVGRTQDDLSIKKETETYLVNAYSFAEAEERIESELLPYCYPGGLEVKSVKAERVVDIFKDEAAEIWYKARLNLITIDEKTGLEKKTKCNVYAKADSLEKALKVVREGIKDLTVNWEFFSITETPILDVYKYQPTI